MVLRTDWAFCGEGLFSIGITQAMSTRASERVDALAALSPGLVFMHASIDIDPKRFH